MLRDIGIINTNSREFEYNCFAIYMIYLFELRTLEYVRFRRINIFINENEIPNIFGETSKTCNIVFPFSVSNYFGLKSDHEKRIAILDLFHDSLVLLCDKLGWNKGDFIKIREKIVEEKFSYTRHWKKYKCKGKTNVKAFLVAQVLFSHVNYFVCFEKDNVVFFSQLIFEGISTWLYWDTLFKKFTWIDSCTFTISDSKELVSFNCDFTKQIFTLVIDSDRKAIAEREIKKWSANITEDERVRLILLDLEDVISVDNSLKL